jgi:hypothetical protein
MNTQNSTSRLFVIFARDASAGVIFRRGPSKWVQLIHWNTAKDIFTPGQWFKGRIYERNSDLSPDGKLMIYLAYKPFNQRANPSYGDRWTAISKPPYFTALALWQFYGNLRNGGGGYFEGNKKVKLNHLEDNIVPHRDHPPMKINVEYPPEEGDFRHELYYDILRRNGWKASFVSEVSRFGVPQIRVEGQLQRKWQSKLIWLKSNEHFIIKHRIFFDQRLWLYPEYLRDSREYQYIIINKSTNTEYDLSNISWADFDQRGRLVLAKDGKLLSGTLNETGELDLKELADFNMNKPESIATPKWATKW